MTTGTTTPTTSMPIWTPRRWAVAAAVTAAYVLVVGIPTDLIDTPLFWREIPPTWWSWPALVVSAALAGLLTATYVAPPRGPHADAPDDSAAKGDRRGLIGGFLTFFAVGCPVCNKLVLLALGTSGALAWFEPIQPLLQVFAIALLIWALVTRLRSERACTLPPAATIDRPTQHTEVP